jgi:hypothetical protein
MRRTLIACAAAAAIGLVSVAQPAQARNGGAVAAGVIGGLAVGAIIGGAAARGPYDGPVYAPAYAPAPVYVAPDQRMCVRHQQVWSNRYQAYVERPVRVPCY